MNRGDPKILFPVVALLLLFFSQISPLLLAAETIEIAGARYANVEMVETSPEGVIYKTEDGEFVTLSWKSLAPNQVTAVKAKLQAAMMNSLFDAHFVKGTVFDANRDGIVIQIDVEAVGDGPGFKDGARIVDEGLVIIRDLPSHIPRGVGAEIAVIAYKQGTYTFDIGIAQKEIPRMVVAKPIWGREQEWKNSEGQTMAARFIAMKNGKILFEKAGKTFLYDLANLDADGQKRAAEYQEKIGDFPIP